MYRYVAYVDFLWSFIKVLLPSIHPNSVPTLITPVTPLLPSVLAISCPTPNKMHLYWGNVFATAIMKLKTMATTIPGHPKLWKMTTPTMRSAQCLWQLTEQ